MAQTRTLPITIAVLLLLTGVAAVGTWLAFAPTGGEPLTILFTGETLGRMEPCMCDGELAGGLGFRASAIAAQKPPFVLLDTGNIVSGRSLPDRERGAAILRLMQDMGYMAINIGENEAACGREWLVAQARAGIPFVSANVRVSDDDVVPSRIVSRVAGARAVVTGLLDPASPRPPTLSIEPLAIAMERLMTAHQASAESAYPLIVLADISRPQAEELARTFPEIAAILLRAKNDTLMPTPVNRTMLASIYGGRYLAHLTLTWPEGSLRPPQASMQAFTLTQSAGAVAEPSPLPEGITMAPSQLDFGTLLHGASATRTITIGNRSGGPLVIARVYSPCTCFVMDFPESAIADGSEAAITVTLHSVSLQGENRFSLYVQIKGAEQDVYSIPATVNATSRTEGL